MLFIPTVWDFLSDLGKPFTYWYCTHFQMLPIYFLGIFRNYRYSPQFFVLFPVFDNFTDFWHCAFADFLFLYSPQLLVVSPNFPQFPGLFPSVSVLSPLSTGTLNFWHFLQFRVLVLLILYFLVEFWLGIFAAQILGNIL